MGVLNPKVQSDLAVLKDDVFVNTAGSINLDSVASNLGLDRPPLGWHDDEQFRALVRKLSLTPHPPVQALRILLELVLGPACTKVRTLMSGQGSPAIFTGTAGGPFSISVGAEILVISAQGGLPVTVPLTTGAAVTATQIIADINAADLQVEASLVGGNIQVVATGTIIGRHSTIELHGHAQSAHATLGFTLGLYRGADDLGITNTKFKFDTVEERFTGDYFPQWARSLILDEHGPNQETVNYDFHETGPLNTVEVTTALTQVHSKYLPVAGTTLQFEAIVGATTLTIVDNTGFPTGTYYAILLNRGEITEEYLQVASSAGSVLTLSEGLRFDHIDGETVELLYYQNLAPSLLANTAAAVTQLTLNDSTIFPKANFTIIVARATKYEETFWISENDHDGTGSTGVPNTLVINGTHHATAPASTAYAHDAGVLVEPAQAQLKGCGWRIEETTSSADLKIIIPECCISDIGSKHAYIHEEIEISDKPGTGIAAVNLTANASAGDTEVRIATSDLGIPYPSDNKLWGDGAPSLGGDDQRFEDKEFLNRSCVLTEGGTSEERLVVKIKEFTRLVPRETSSITFGGYPVGSTALYVEDGSVFAGIATPFNVVINRGEQNSEIRQCTAVTYDPIGYFPSEEGTWVRWRLTVAATGKSHGLFKDDADPTGTGGDVGESVEPADHVHLLLAAPLENSYAFATPTTIKVINDPPFLYDTGVLGPYGLDPPPGADDLQDGGFGYAEAPKLQNGRYAGFFTYKSPGDMPVSIVTGLSSAVVGSLPEAIRKIPAPTEIMGFCTSDPTSSVVDPGFTQNGTLPVGAGPIYVVVADVTLWPPLAGDAVAPYPYPVNFGKDTVNWEYADVSNKIIIDVAMGAGADTPFLNPSSVKGIPSGWNPGILVINGGLTNSHATYNATTGDRGDLAVIRVEQLVLDDASNFPIGGGEIYLDFGHASQETATYSSRNGKALIFDPHVEFKYQHPAAETPPYTEDIDPSFSGQAADFCSVSLKTASSYSLGSDGHDNPIYLPGDPTGMLMSGASEPSSVINAIRTAGVKIVIETGEDFPCTC